MGMTFNGVHSDTIIGLTCAPRRFVLPTRRRAVAEVIGRDGVFDYEADGLEPRILAVDCLLKSDTASNLRARLNDIAVWLSGRGYLIFDNDPTKRWEAKLYAGWEPEYIPLAAKFTLHFEAQPYAEDAAEVAGTIDTEQDYGSGIKFYPLIEIEMTSAATSLQVSLVSTGEYVLLMDDLVNGDVISIDMNRGKVEKNDGTVMDKVSLDSIFFGVPPGDQTITVTTDGTYLSGIWYRKRYLYA